jgi:glutathione synthase/RimK-type ligase-like ATP-grasp enzyme
MDQNKTGDAGMTCPELVAKLQESLVCLKLSAQELGLDFFELGEFKDILLIKTSSRDLYFWLNKNPFNDSFIFLLGQDKFLQSQIFQKLNITIPKTFYHFPKQTNLPQDLKFPSILKPNNSSFSKGLNLIEDKSELESVLASDPAQKWIIQSYIKGQEYRVVTVKNKIKLVYPKIGNHRFKNPDLQNYKPQKIQDQNLIQLFQPIVDQLYKGLKVNFSGLDIIVDNKGQAHLIELNANPVCYFYNLCNGRQDFIAIYSELLQEYQN